MIDVQPLYARTAVVSLTSGSVFGSVSSSSGKLTLFKMVKVSEWNLVSRIPVVEYSVHHWLLISMTLHGRIFALVFVLSIESIEIATLVPTSMEFLFDFESKLTCCLLAAAR